MQQGPFRMRSQPQQDLRCTIADRSIGICNLRHLDGIRRSATGKEWSRLFKREEVVTVSTLKKLSAYLIELILGCWHQKISRPFTIAKQTYEVCLDCGKQFSYSLHTMSVVRNS